LAKGESAARAQFPSALQATIVEGIAATHEFSKTVYKLKARHSLVQKLYFMDQRNASLATLQIQRPTKTGTKPFLTTPVFRPLPQ
jgi:hypothetical protein